MKKWKIVLCWTLLLILLCGNASAAVSMKKGSRSYNVLFLQERLNQLGYNAGEADGIYDAETVTAVKAFQGDHGLQETGLVKDDTWQAVFDQKFTIRYDMGLGKRDYTLNARLTVPFATVEVYDSSSQQNTVRKNQVKLATSGIECLITILLSEENIDDIVSELQKNDRDEFDTNFAGSYNGKNYKASAGKASKINGKAAKIWTTTWNFTNGDKLIRYCFRGVMELDQVGDKQAYAIATMGYNIPKSASAMTKSLGATQIRDVLTNIRCDRDRLYEYQAGAAKRRKASKLKKFELPAFQPVDEKDQGTLDMIYEIWHYVDPDADGSSGSAPDADTCVSM